MDTHIKPNFSSIPVGTNFWGEDGLLYEKVSDQSAGQIIVHVDGSRNLEEAVRFYAEEQVKIAEAE